MYRLIEKGKLETNGDYAISVKRIDDRQIEWIEIDYAYHYLTSRGWFNIQITYLEDLPQDKSFSNWPYDISNKEGFLEAFKQRARRAVVVLPMESKGGGAMEGFIGVIIGSIITGGLPIIRDYINARREKEIRGNRIKLLKEMLQNEVYKWRKIETLSAVIGCSPEDTKTLLIEAGARGSTEKEDVWGLLSKHPLEKITKE